MRWLVVGLILLVLFVSELRADEIFLKNGDKISGKIIEETETTVTLRHPHLGKLSMSKKVVERVEHAAAQVQKADLDPVAAEDEARWKRNISLGYNASGGNTESSRASVRFKGSRKTDHDEWSTKGDVYYASSQGKMTAQKYYGLLRYAFSFGETLKWYNFYKLEADHDRFANIDYRIIPSVGAGYWFADTKSWKLMTELAVGWEYTDFRHPHDISSEAILVPRLFMEKRIFKASRLSQDITLYPSLSDIGQYRSRSETKFTNPISDRLSWSVTFIDDYNSDPAAGTKKNDYRLISALDYIF